MARPTKAALDAAMVSLCCPHGELEVAYPGTPQARKMAEESGAPAFRWQADCRRCCSTWDWDDTPVIIRAMLLEELGLIDYPPTEVFTGIDMTEMRPNG